MHKMGRKNTKNDVILFLEKFLLLLKKYVTKLMPIFAAEIINA